MNTNTLPKVEFVIIVGYPRDPMAGRYLEGPRTPKEVRKHGYGFTLFPERAWGFQSLKQATAKARIVECHMSWGEGVLIVEERNSEAAK